MLPGVNDLKEGVLSFLRPRRKEDGGYGATPKLPASAEDTYHALRILAAFGMQADPAGQDDALKNYLARLKKIGGMGARTTFHMLAACRLAGAPVDAGDAMAFVREQLDRTAGLTERYYCARIVREVLGAAAPQAPGMPGDFSQIPWRDATELWMILYLLDGTLAGREASGRRDLVHWLQACQNHDGGFGFLPGTTSFVENCYTCLRALALFDAAPHDSGACRAFILACQTATGGFARINRATAFLDSTWHAVASLSLLRYFCK